VQDIEIDPLEITQCPGHVETELDLISGGPPEIGGLPEDAVWPRGKCPVRIARGQSDDFKFERWIVHIPQGMNPVVKASEPTVNLTVVVRRQIGDFHDPQYIDCKYQFL
jgi:hypothetical protein